MSHRIPISPWKRYVASVVVAALLSWPAWGADEPAVVDSPEKAVAAQAASATKLGKPVDWVNSIGMKFRLIPAVEFMMGSEDGSADEMPHRVRLTTPYYIGCFEVTRTQWETVTGTKHSDYFPGPEIPMNCISRAHTMRFIMALNKLEGLDYRLPTEAEWEFAARAGSATAFPTGDTQKELDKAGWYAGNDGGTLHPVGQKTANAFGLYDMNGNAWEWCDDLYDAQYYSVSPLENPTGPARSLTGYRVLRGGAAFFDARSCRSTTRNYLHDSRTTKLTGFRIVLPVTGKAPAKPGQPPPKQGGKP